MILVELTTQGCDCEPKAPDRGSEVRNPRVPTTRGSAVLRVPRVTGSTVCCLRGRDVAHDSPPIETGHALQRVSAVGDTVGAIPDIAAGPSAAAMSGSEVYE